MYVFSIFYVFRYLQMHMCTLAFGVAKEKKKQIQREREREETNQLIFDISILVSRIY